MDMTIDSETVDNIGEILSKLEGDGEFSFGGIAEEVSNYEREDALRQANYVQRILSFKLKQTTKFSRNT